jgi:ATP-dependent DNA helicase RecG
MTEEELKAYLQQNFPKENESCEWKEFKNMKNDFEGKERKDVTSYVSALANMEGGFLVIGVKDGTFEVVGTDNYNYPVEKVRLRLKNLCANLPTEGLEVNEFITNDTQKRVWIIRVPKHQCRLPVYAHSKPWQRVNDSIVEMTKSRLDAILCEQVTEEDWSASIVSEATIADLDPKAISRAREKFIELNLAREKEIREWDDITFLNKAKLTRQGKITNATIILLGRNESEHFISPSVCQIRWSLKDGSDENKDFKIFTIPMILAIDEIADTIRNTNYTYTIEGNLFPESMRRYDVFTLREPINNAIAHQDYTKAAKIDIIEYEDDKLMFSNYGRFIPGSIDEVLSHDFPEARYRNRFLVEAMRNVKMVDTEGGGIKKLFVQQKKRFFPMPQYDLRDGQVKCTIAGRILDENFAKVLANNPSLTLGEIVLLDKVQKHESITDDSLSLLRKKKFVEGRKPNIYISKSIAGESKYVGLKAIYIRNKGFDDEYFKKLIIEYISKFNKATRQEINELLKDKLPETLSREQRFDKITNLLAFLRRSGKIKVGENRSWVLVN